MMVTRSVRQPGKAGDFRVAADAIQVGAKLGPASAAATRLSTTSKRTKIETGMGPIVPYPKYSKLAGTLPV